MKANILQIKKVLSTTLFVLLLMAVGMTHVLAQQGVLNGVFSVNSGGEKVRFSQGNLQCRPYAEIWRLADHQYDCIGTGNTHISQSYTGYIDLFGWGTSGYSHGAVCYEPWSTSMNDENYYAYGNSTYNLYDRTGYADWGHNLISNRRWRTLKTEEWIYIINQRYTQSGLRYAKAQVNGVNGLILLPDDWSTTYYTLYYPDQYGVGYNTNVITSSQWSTLENHGAVFLPAAGIRGSSSVFQLNSTGAYWSSSCVGVMGFDGSSVGCNNNDRHTGRSVRLVCDAYTIGVSANPAVGGSVTGSGTYVQGQSCTLHASPGSGYFFVNWTENGTPVSTNANYSFSVTGNRTLVANFQQQSQSYIINISANPASGGTVSGGGSYEQGATCTLTASANVGYTFINWTENGNVVSTNANYSFTVTSDGTYVANFSTNTYQISAVADPSEGGTITGAGIYNYGASCTLTATPATGYTFTNWTKNGNVVSTNVSYSFTVTEDASYVAHFSPNNYQITATADPSAGGTINGEGSYNYGSLCTLTATPAEGYGFVKWTKNGTQVSTNASYTFTVTASESYVAHFAQQIMLPTVSTNAVTNITETAATGGGNVTSDGGATVTARGVCWSTSHNPTVSGSHTPSGSGIGSFTCLMTGLTANTTYYVRAYATNSQGTAYGGEVSFVTSQLPTYTISVSPSPNTGGTVSGGGTYQQGQSCTVSATANDGYSFANWTENGNVVSTNYSYSFTVNSNRNLVANFTATPQTYIITVSANPGNGGIVTGGGSYEQGQPCTITATPAMGYNFVKWTKNGTLVSTNATYNFIVTESASYVAHFSIGSYQITAAANPTLGGSVSGTGSYYFGSSCTLTASANSGYAFANWTENGNVVSDNFSYSFTVTSNRSLVANFTANPLPNYTISAFANPAFGGAVAGDGIYQQGQLCIVKAMANLGYAFVNWTENGTVVSTSVDYFFTVTGNRTLLANFVDVDGLEEQDTGEVSLYPNPVCEKLTVELNNPVDLLEIYSLTGALVYSKTDCPGTVEIDVRALVKGSYLIRLSMGTSVVTRVFVKQ